MTASTPQNPRANLFGYATLGDFLRDFVEYKRSTVRAWTMGVWARDLKVSNVATITRIVSGERQAGEALCEKLVTYFAFGASEAEYFRHLVMAEKKSMRDYAGERLHALRAKQQLAPAQNAQGIFEARAGAYLILWGDVDTAAFNRALAGEQLEAIDNQGRALSAMSVADYDESPLGPFRQGFFCVLAKKIGAQLDKAGFYYHFLFCDEPRVSTFGRMVWGNVHQLAKLDISKGAGAPVAAAIAAEQEIFSLAMSQAVALPQSEEAAPHVYCISNQPHYHCRYLAEIRMHGQRRLFLPEVDTLSIGASPAGAFMRGLDFKPYSWGSYTSLHTQIFGPESL